MPLAVALKLTPVPEKPLFDFLKGFRVRRRGKGVRSQASSPGTHTRGERAEGGARKEEEAGEGGGGGGK